MWGMGFARVREDKSADAELARSGITALHGKGGGLDHRVIKVKPTDVRLIVKKRMRIYTTLGEVQAEPAEWLVSNKYGCYVVKAPSDFIPE